MMTALANSLLDDLRDSFFHHAANGYNRTRDLFFHHSPLKRAA